MAKEQKQIKLAGFNITKILAEKNPEAKGELKLVSNIKIKDIEKFKPELAKQESLKVEFEFEVSYGSFGKISISGLLFILTDPKTMKDILKDYQDKKFDTPVQTALINLINQKASLKAFELEEELGLPVHIRLPVLHSQSSENSK